METHSPLTRGEMHAVTACLSVCQSIYLCLSTAQQALNYCTVLYDQSIH